jgi:hypothetical protein
LIRIVDVSISSCNARPIPPVGDVLFLLTTSSVPTFLNACTVFRGCSSFLESNSGYPEKYENDGELVGLTKVNSPCHCSSLSAQFHMYHFIYTSVLGTYLTNRKALSTNMLYYSGYKYASKMGRELGLFDDSIQYLEEMGNMLKISIQSR